jgi:hypothetical protein
MLDSRHQFPEILNLKGMLLAQQHQYAAAAEQLRAYLKLTFSERLRRTPAAGRRRKGASPIGRGQAGWGQKVGSHAP